MKKKMEEIEVATGGNADGEKCIYITQPGHGNDDAVVSFSQEQADALIQWIKEELQPRWR